MTKQEAIAACIARWGSPAWVGRARTLNAELRFAVGVPGTSTPLVLGVGRSWEKAMSKAEENGFDRVRVDKARADSAALKEQWMKEEAFKQSCVEDSP